MNRAFIRSLWATGSALALMLIALGATRSVAESELARMEAQHSLSETGHLTKYWAYRWVRGDDPTLRRQSCVYLLSSALTEPVDEANLADIGHLLQSSPTSERIWIASMLLELSHSRGGSRRAAQILGPCLTSADLEALLAEGYVQHRGAFLPYVNEQVASRILSNCGLQSNDRDISSRSWERLFRTNENEYWKQVCGKGHDSAHRQIALESVGDLLNQTLVQKPTRVRTARALESLARDGDPVVARISVRILVSRDLLPLRFLERASGFPVEVRSELAEALTEEHLNTPAIRSWVYAESNVEVQHMLAGSMASMKFAVAGTHLIRYLRSSSFAVRNAAARSLGRIGDPRALTALERQLTKVTLSSSDLPLSKLEIETLRGAMKQCSIKDRLSGFFPHFGARARCQPLPTCVRHANYDRREVFLIGHVGVTSS